MSLIKRIKWPGWIVLILLVVVIISAVYQSIYIKTVIANNNKLKNLSITTVYNHHVSEFPGLKLLTKTEETNKYTLSMSIPTIDSEIVNIAIKKWIDQQKKEFKEEVKQKDNQLGNGDAAHLNIQVDTEKITDDIYSLLFTLYRYTGGANRLQTVKPFTIDTKQNKILQLSDILNLNEDASKDIPILIKEELKKDKDLNVDIMEDLLKKPLGRLNDLKWTISKDSLTIYFDAYEISSGAMGVIEVEIPIEKLNSYINDNRLMEGQEPKHVQDEEVKIEQRIEELEPNGKYIALTFDDGPNPKVTPRVLEALQQNDAKATFFMLGNQVENYPSVAEQVAKAGHEVASHSNSHSDMTKLNNEAMKQEFNETSNKIEKAIGKKPTLFRPPYGAYNDNVLNYANNNYSIILWSVDSLDWKSRNASAVIDMVTRNVTNGSIILLHDIHASTADALPELLASLRNQGYQFITVSELLAIQKESGVGPHFGKVF